MPHPEDALAQTREAMKGESAMNVKNAARARFCLVSNVVMECSFRVNASSGLAFSICDSAMTTSRP